jgi:hypothetical protein
MLASCTPTLMVSTAAPVRVVQSVLRVTDSPAVVAVVAASPSAAHAGASGPSNTRPVLIVTVS